MRRWPNPADYVARRRAFFVVRDTFYSVIVHLDNPEPATVESTIKDLFFLTSKHEGRVYDHFYNTMYVDESLLSRPFLEVESFFKTEDNARNYGARVKAKYPKAIVEIEERPMAPTKKK